MRSPAPFLALACVLLPTYPTPQQVMNEANPARKTVKEKDARDFDDGDRRQGRMKAPDAADPHGDHPSSISVL